MSAIVYDYVETYLKNLTKNDEDAIVVLEEYARENNVPIIQKEAGRLLEAIVCMTKPEKILELGTAIGYSSILMSRCAGSRTKIKTIERNSEMIKLARTNIEYFDCADSIEILEGECLEILKNIDEKFDLIFIDAGKGHYSEFFPHCVRLLKDNGVIVSDNVLFRGMVASDDIVDKRMSTIVKRMRSYLSMLMQNKEFLTSVVPIGDGLAVSVRRSIDEKA